MELVVNVEMFVEIFLAEHVEQSGVDELRLKHATVLRQSQAVQPVAGDPTLVQLRRVRVLTIIVHRQ